MKPVPDAAFPILVIDTSSPRTIVGLGAAAADWIWHEDHRESGIALFAAVADLLKDRAMPLNRLSTVAFCEGPGSILGIRTAAMALRTWAAGGFLREAELMTYSSLGLAAAGLCATLHDEAFTVALDARRQSWYFLTNPRRRGKRPEIRRVPAGESSRFTGPVFLPEGFPVWNPQPESWTNCPYNPRLLESPDTRRAILRPVAQPDAFQLDAPTYRKWTPSISRARSEPAQPPQTPP